MKLNSFGIRMSLLDQDRVENQGLEVFHFINLLFPNNLSLFFRIADPC